MIQVTTLGNATFSTKTVKPGWYDAGSNSTNIYLVPATPKINVGTFNPFHFCLDYGSSPQLVQIKWWANQEVVCDTIMEFACENCIKIVEDSIWCENGTYKYIFKWKNLDNFDIYKLKPVNADPATALFSPPILNFSPPVYPNNSHGFDTLSISNVGAADSLCFQFRAEDINRGWCISDTICLQLPPCSSCDSVGFSLDTLMVMDENCCYSINIENNYDPNF
ncbi:MAG: hypothetical protein R2798_11220 [Chitinophagales bacterium]|nr:hypothetical protein [Bacteroidota bacterium]MCB9043223.1 hypothetical protein [Chitinophagales bacterium]